MQAEKTLLLAVAVLGAALFAAFRREPTTEVRKAEESQQAAESLHPSMDDEQGADDEQLPPGHPPINDQAEGANLPPGHPPIGAGETKVQPSDKESPQAIRWTIPQKWETVPNASPMRLATYHVLAAPGAADEAELTVVRAGGSTEANLKRWVEQFENPTNEKRAQKTIRGFKISTIEVQGGFKKGGMGPGETATRSGWMLEGAVVETDQGPYFFKLTGPAASVQGARRDFDALLDSVSPATSETRP